MDTIDKSKILIRVVDDDPTIRDSLEFMLRYEGYSVKCWANAMDYLTSDTPSRPGCLILDIKMPGITGSELQKILVEREISTPIIFLTAHGSIELAVEGMKTGAVDFLQKPLQPEKFFAALEKSIKLDLKNKLLMPDPHEVAIMWDKLSNREQQVAKFSAEGLSSQQIAGRLGLSKKTVENHRALLYLKLGIKSKEELRRLYLANPKGPNTQV